MKKLIPIGLFLLCVVMGTTAKSATILDEKIHGEFPYALSFTEMGYVNYYSDVSSFGMLSVVGVGLLNADELNEIVKTMSPNNAVQRPRVEISLSEINGRWAEDEKRVGLGVLLPLGNEYGLDMNLERQANAYQFKDALRGEVFKSVGELSSVGLMFSYKDIRTTSNVFIAPKEVKTKSYEYGIHFSHFSNNVGKFNLKFARENSKTETSDIFGFCGFGVGAGLGLNLASSNGFTCTNTAYPATDKNDVNKQEIGGELWLDSFTLSASLKNDSYDHDHESSLINYSTEYFVKDRHLGIKSYLNENTSLSLERAEYEIDVSLPITTNYYSPYILSLSYRLPSSGLSFEFSGTDDGDYLGANLKLDFGNSVSLKSKDRMRR